MISHDLTSLKRTEITDTDTLVAVMMNLCSTTFAWTIPDFLEYDQDRDPGLIQSGRIRGHESEGPEFSVAVRPWGFHRFQNTSEDEHVSVYLRVHNVEGKSYNISYKFSILDSAFNKYHTLEDERTITMEGESCGNHSFIKRSDLLSEMDTHLPNGALTIYAEIYLLNGINGGMPVNDPQIGLQTSHASTEKLEDLPRDLWNLYKSGELADRYFIVKGVKKTAHSAILAARSPGLSKLFADGSTEVTIRDMKPEVFESVLQSIYTETLVENLEARAEDLLVASNTYGLHKLKQRAEAALVKQVAVQNVAHLLILAFDHDAPELKEYAMRFLIENKTAVKGTPGWRSLARNPEVMFELFASI